MATLHHFKSYLHVLSFLLLLVAFFQSCGDQEETCRFEKLESYYSESDYQGTVGNNLGVIAEISAYFKGKVTISDSLFANLSTQEREIRQVTYSQEKIDSHNLFITALCNCYEQKGYEVDSTIRTDCNTAFRNYLCSFGLLDCEDKDTIIHEPRTPPPLDPKPKVDQQQVKHIPKPEAELKSTNYNLLLSYEDGTPVEGVGLYIERGNELVRMQTNAEGLIQLKDVLPSGNLHILSKNNLLRIDTSFILSPSQGGILEAKVDFPEFIVSGAVADDAGRVLEGVVITAEVPTKYVEAVKTDRGGMYKLFLKAKPEAIVKVIFRKEGYQINQQKQKLNAVRGNHFIVNAELKKSPQ